MGVPAPAEVCYPSFAPTFGYPVQTAVLPPITTAVTTQALEPRTYMYTSYTPYTRYTTQYVPMTTATTQYAPVTQCYTAYQPTSYTTYATGMPSMLMPHFSPYGSVSYF